MDDFLQKNDIGSKRPIHNHNYESGERLNQIFSTKIIVFFNLKK